MTAEERRAWIMGILAAVGYGIYLAIVISVAGRGELTEVDYVPVLLWTVGASIAASIVLSIVASIASRSAGDRDADAKDHRDAELYRRGQYVGLWFVAAGAILALVIAMADGQAFWIANTIYLAFTLSAVATSVVRVVGYRRGFSAW
ncbi:hypothetical protein ACL9RL_09610 [Plantibacter sp. Mn2098]|uniref:hypothetical protein n=1 Tax=Plantibacter sp. Mn2098 TaxID=3395266 RepID=UPI003BCBAE8C